MDDIKDEETLRRYQTRDLTRALGVSRASLTNYEQAGLINPRRDEKTGVREYDNDNVFDLFAYSALGNMGLSAKEVVASRAAGEDLFDEVHLERYLASVSAKIAYYQGLREAVDRMRSIRLRERVAPGPRVEYVERHVFIEDGAENGYLGFKGTDELDALIGSVPIAGFGIVFGISENVVKGDAESEVRWKWGRTFPARLAAVAGVKRHYPLQVGGCECITAVSRVEDDEVPPPASVFVPLYAEASRLGREVAGEPFVPYIFPPHPGTPFVICLPLQGA